MLKNIFKAIDKKSQEEIKKTVVEKEKMILDIERKFQKEIEEKRNRERKGLQERAEKEIEEFGRKKELEMKFEIQKTKQRILDKVYKQAIKNVEELPGKQFQEIVIKIANDLPGGISGEISADPKTSNILRKVLVGNVIQGDLKESGFIFKSPRLEIDLRFSEILKQKREEIEPELNKILFG